MMAEWWRSWHGAPTDPKWLAIAKRAGVPCGIAVAVGWALLDRASQAEDRGSITGYDAEALAVFFGCDEAQVVKIVAGMRGKGMLDGDRFAAWDKRQARLPWLEPRWQKIRRSVFKRDGRACRYCGCRSGPFDINHIFPRSRGGSDALENLAVACFSCNRSKGAKTPEEWLA
jgi:hypothetical protein